MKKLVLLVVLVGIVFGGQLSSQGGRFVLGQISNYRADQYLLDTQTGQVWQIAKEEDNSTVLQPIKIISYVTIKNKKVPVVDYIPYFPYGTKKNK